MATSDENSLKGLGRVELLELLVEQGEELERIQSELAVVQARAAYQERIARLAEDAAARLSGILEAAQLAQNQYSQNLRDLKAQMGVKTASVSKEHDDESAGSSATADAGAATSADASLTPDAGVPGAAGAQTQPSTGYEGYGTYQGTPGYQDAGSYQTGYPQYSQQGAQQYGQQYTQPYGQQYNQQGNSIYQTAAATPSTADGAATAAYQNGFPYADPNGSGSYAAQGSANTSNGEGGENPQWQIPSL